MLNLIITTKYHRYETPSDQAIDFLSEKVIEPPPIYLFQRYLSFDILILNKSFSWNYTTTTTTTTYYY